MGKGDSVRGIGHGLTDNRLIMYQASGLSLCNLPLKGVSDFINFVKVTKR